MHKECRSALIAMTGAIGLAAAIIAVGVSAGTIMAKDNGYRMLKAKPAPNTPPQKIRQNSGKPDLVLYLSNRS